MTIPDAVRQAVAAATAKIREQQAASQAPAPTASSSSNPFNGAKIAGLAAQNNALQGGGMQSAGSMLTAYKNNLAASGTSSQPAAAPTTNYGGTGNPLNEILYSKKQYDAGNKDWASKNAQQFYGMLDPNEASAIHGMNTQQLEAYINSKNNPGTSGNTGISPSGGQVAVQSYPSSQPSSQPSASQPAGYQSSYTGPDMAGMQSQLNAQYDQAQAAQLQQLRNALATALQGYNSQETQANQSAYANRNAADVAAAQNEQRTREQMANAGLTTDGQNLTLSAAQGASRLGALNDINQTQANALQDISQKRSLLQNNEAGNELALIQQLGSDKAAALLDLLKYGDTRAFDVDQAKYGRYRDDVNQQFAEDQFDFNKQQQQIQNDAQYGGVYGNNPTFAALQQMIQNDAQYGGTYNGGRSLQGTASDQAAKQANWNAFMDIVGQTGNLGGGPTQNWGSLVNNAGTGAPTLAGQQFQSSEQQRALDNAWTASSQTGKVTPELSQLTGIPAGTQTQAAQQYWNNYNRGVLESDRSFGLQQDANDLDWIQAMNSANGSNKPPDTISATAAGQLLNQSLSKVVGSDPASGKPVYGTVSDPVTREKTFLNVLQTSGVAFGPDVVEMLTKGGYTNDEIAKYQSKYPEAFQPEQPAFNSGGGGGGAYSTYVNQSAAKWGVPSELLNAVLDAESSGNPNAVSSAGAQGLMQLMPDTAKGLGVRDPFDPAQNIDGGAQYLKGLLDTYGGDYRKALAGYNAGGGAVQKAIAKYGDGWFAHMPAETQAYVTKIMRGG